MPPIQIGALRPDRRGAFACSGTGDTDDEVIGAGGVRLGCCASGEGNPPAPPTGFWSYWSGPGRVMHTA